MFRRSEEHLIRHHRHLLSTLAMAADFVMRLNEVIMASLDRAMEVKRLSESDSVKGV